MKGYVGTKADDKEDDWGDHDFALVVPNSITTTELGDSEIRSHEINEDGTDNDDIS